jgi:hypothetical protein
MKAILEAFGGKLRSEPLDFPEEMRGVPEIHMMLDLDIVKTVWVGEYCTKLTEGLSKRGRFVRTSAFDPKHDAHIYTLVEIK